MHWPQITYIIILVVGIVAIAHSHGETKTRSFLSSLLALGLVLGITIPGGFFVIIGWPQMIFIVLWTVGVTRALLHDGEQYTENFLLALMDLATTVGLLWWGGFFPPL